MSPLGLRLLWVCEWVTLWGPTRCFAVKLRDCEAIGNDLGLSKDFVADYARAIGLGVWDYPSKH